MFNFQSNVDLNVNKKPKNKTQYKKKLDKVSGFITAFTTKQRNKIKNYYSKGDVSKKSSVYTRDYYNNGDDGGSYKCNANTFHKAELVVWNKGKEVANKAADASYTTFSLTRDTIHLLLHDTNNNKVMSITIILSLVKGNEKINVYCF